jgi:hypothetical protein
MDLIETNLISFLTTDRSYNRSFLKELMEIEEMDLVYMIETFDPSFDSFFFDWIKAHPQTSVILVESFVVKEEQKDFLERLLKFKQFSNFFIRYVVDLPDPANIPSLISQKPVRNQRVLFGKLQSIDSKKGIEALFVEVEKIHYILLMQFYEQLGLERLFTHYVKNCAVIKNSCWIEEKKGQLKGVPALILGAGPSLKDAIEIFDQIEKKGVIFACGTAISILSDHGKKPHFLVATCPRDTAVEAVKKNRFNDVIALFNPRIHPACQEFLGKNKVFCSSGNSLLDELFGIDYLVEEACEFTPSTVSTFAILQAIHLGCYPIILSGVDLCFDHDSKYFGEQKKLKNEHKIQRKGVQDQIVETTMEWVLDGLWMEELLKKNPNLQIISTAKKTLFVNGIKYKSWEVLLNNDLMKEYELTLMDEFSLRSENLDRNIKLMNKVKELKNSFQRVLDLVQEIAILLNEGINPLELKLVLLQSDLEDEIAYKSILKKMIEGVMNQSFQNVDRDFEEDQFIIFNDQLKLISAIVPRYLQIIEENPIC